MHVGPTSFTPSKIANLNTSEFPNILQTRGVPPKMRKKKTRYVSLELSQEFPTPKQYIDFVNTEPRRLPAQTRDSDGHETVASRASGNRVFLLNQLAGEGADVKRKVQELYDSTESVDEFWGQINLLPAPHNSLKLTVKTLERASDKEVEKLIIRHATYELYEPDWHYHFHMPGYSATETGAEWNSRHSKNNSRSLIRVIHPTRASSHWLRASLKFSLSSGSLRSGMEVRVIDSVAHFHIYHTTFGVPNHPCYCVWGKDLELCAHLERKIELDMVQIMEFHLNGAVFEGDEFNVKLLPFSSPERATVL